MDLKYSIKGQIISVILEHLKTVFLLFVLWLIAISATVSKVGSAVYAAVATLFYCAAMYSACYSQAKNDKKSYSSLVPNKYKGALLSAGLLVINVAVILIYIFVWKVASDGENLLSLYALAANAFCLFWFSPFISFFSAQKGAIPIIVYASVFILPLISCFLGYLAGYKDFDISSKLKFLMYENKKGTD